MDTLNLLSQRRVWAAIIGFTATALSVLHMSWNIDVPVLTELLTDFGGAVSTLATASLALYSFLKPKKDVGTP